MCPASTERVSELLLNWGHGDQNAHEELIPLVYAELRRIARRYLCQERPDPTLQSGALALDDTLTRLATLDPQHSRLVELRFFGGLSVGETAVVLGISPAKVKREWATARAWLQREMK